MYSHEYNSAIEIDKNGLSGGNIDYEIKKQKTIEQEFGCRIIRTNLDQEEFHFFKPWMNYLDTSNNQLKKF